MLISTIIPVYNAEKFLCKCLDSLINAQISEVTNEIILIDDGSTDNSLEICKDYESNHNNIKVFSQKNQGPSVARNVGLNKALGDWITFVDSDDWVDQKYFSTFLKLREKEAELLLFGYNKVSNFKSIEHTVFEGTISSKIILNETLKYHNVLWFPWNKFYKREIIEKHQLRFNPKVKIGEDTLFNISYLKNTNQVYSAQDILYNYVEVETSLTQVKFKENLLINMEMHFLERKQLQPENNNDLANYYINHILFWLINNTRNSHYNKLKEIKAIRESVIYKELFKYYQFNWRKPKQALIVKLFQLKQYNLLMKLTNIYA